MKIDVKPPEFKGYIIFNPVTGLFSTGGTNPSWKPMGKIWKNIGNLKNHLNQFLRVNYGKKEVWCRDTYVGCVVVDIRTMETVDEFDIYNYMRKTYETHKTYNEARGYKWLGILSDKDRYPYSYSY